MLIRLSTWTAACALVPSAVAFYPIEPDYGDSSNGNSERRAALSPPSHPSSNTNSPRGSVTLPLRRVPISSRQNSYNIVNNKDPSHANSVAVDQDGNDLSYMAAITIGNSKEEYHLLLDSAASNTWVMGQDCATDACRRHNTFGEGDSDTLKTDSTTFDITYGTGSVSGTTASDTIHIGSLSNELTFGLATNVSSEFEAYPMDGILGLGRGDNVDGTVEAKGIIEALHTSGVISAKLYGVHFSRASDGVNDGELNLGEPNKDRYSGDLNWQDNVDNDRGFWEVPIMGAGADGTTTNLKGRTGIMDTGTSYMLIPEDDAIAMHKLIDGYSQSGETFSVPCDTKKPIQITFGSQTYNISSTDWVGGTLSSGGCKSNIIGRQTFGETQWLIGDVFFKNVYTVFDLDKSKVGFGVKDPTASGNGNEETSSQAPSTTTSAGASPTASSSETLSTTSVPGTSATSQSIQQGGARQGSSHESMLALLGAVALLVVFV
ncbi:acid protease [Lentithecium fluviatile CBS 122367]|uniref:Acid protease n=1 Tax=Lentithecium fluviatile CBS 122367 TaxID=1168545 RepID=A0A6G1IGQ5_9PLEO|nr:acid protease [Lentithecium fluviatile CBS 122367]